MANADKIKQLMQKRGTVKGQITRFKKFLEDYKVGIPDLVKLNVRLIQFKDAYQPFHKIHDELELLDSENQELQEERFDIQDDYIDLLVEAEKLIIAGSPPRNNTRENSVDLQSHSASSVNTVQPRAEQFKRRVKLPEASLPTFNGEYEDWLPFKDSFTCLIDNQSDLTNVEKLHYLKAAVKGEAAKKIKTISITEENYQRAWDLLQRAYADERLIISKHLTLLLKLPTQDRETAEGLRRLADETQQHVESLAALGICITEEILVQNLELKLHKTTAAKWEESLKRGVFPKLSEMIDFLHKTAACLTKLHGESKESSQYSSNGDAKQNYASQQNKAKKGTKRQAFLTTTAQKCVICQQQHPIWRCKKFLEFTFAQRIQAAKRASLCLLCLRQHGEKECKFKNCMVCKKQQNVLLHEHQSEENTD